MVYLVTKKIKGHEYQYLVNNIREGTKTIQKTIKYLGKKRPISKEEFECIKLSYEKKDWILTEYQDYLSYQDYELMKKNSSYYQKHLFSLDEVSKEKEREKFLSMFISNSNAIEGSTLTVYETNNLLFNDLTPKGYSKKEINMAQNLLNAWIYVEKNHKRLPKKEDLLKLHKMVNQNIESDETLGNYKQIQNYIGAIFTTSTFFVEDRMVDLLKWVRKAYKEINDFEVAFQSHAQFEIIHPFVDGNGRVGRLLLNWLLMYKKLSPLAIRLKKRLDYIEALNNSRKGKVEAISKFCFKEYVKQYEFM